MTESCPQKINFARHALFEKEGFIGQIGLICLPAHNFVAIDDPRTKGRVSKRFADRKEAEHMFEEYIIATVTENGWRLTYNGSRNFG